MKYLQEELKDDLNAILFEEGEVKQSFLVFAKVLGCFESETLVDYAGNQTRSIAGQKASLFLKNMLKDQVIALNEFPKCFSDLQPKFSPSLLQFLTMQQGANKYQMLKLLLSFEEKNHGSISLFVNHFELIKSLKKTLGEDGKPVALSWKKAFERFFILKKYKNITTENVDIAELFLKRGLLEKNFILATETRNEAKKFQTKKHILMTNLKEQTSASEEKDYRNKFTYEFLDKSDAKNFILGLFTDCCATISAENYGKDITKSSIVANDVQNIVVKDDEDRIIAKASLYVNKQQGYGVINEFDISLKYRDGEIITENNKGGWYQIKHEREEQERQEIFDCFLRAISDFASVYDKQNPNMPIKKIVVGMGNNKLKAQLVHLDKQEDVLSVPTEYGFEDARYCQYVLYCKNKASSNQMEK